MSKNFINQKGISLFLLKLYFSDSVENFVGDSFKASEIFSNRKLLRIRRGYHYFLLIFFLTVPENFAGEPINVSETFGYRIISFIGGGHLGIVEKFLFQWTEKLRKKSLLCFRYFLARKKIMAESW